MESDLPPPPPVPPRAPGSPLRALVVEGGAPLRRSLGAIAQSQGLEVTAVADGGAAIQAAGQSAPDVVLLDLDLPDADGLGVLAHLHTDHPEVPVVVVAGAADMARVEAALDHGAVNFLGKPVKTREVVWVLDRIRRALQEEEDLTEALHTVVERWTRLEVPCDVRLIPRVVAWLGRELTHHYPGFKVPLADVKLALYEALANAVEHGSLEIDFEGKAEAMIDPRGLADLVRRRQADPRLGGRTVHVVVRYDPEAVVYRVRDEGTGFDPTAYSSGRALADVDALHGRGLALIRHYMDEVEWNDRGNEIRMVRRMTRLRPRAAGEPSRP